MSKPIAAAVALVALIIASASTVLAMVCGTMCAYSIARFRTGGNLFSDWLLQRAEVVAGRRFENRSLVFFCILLVLAVVSFSLIGQLTGTTHGS